MIVRNSESISGNPAVSIAADGVDFTQAGSSVLSASAAGPAVAITGSGVIFTVDAGATVTASGGTTAISGSEHGDTIVNRGAIHGIIDLGNGNDVVEDAGGKFTSADSWGHIRLGGGDDTIITDGGNSSAYGRLFPSGQVWGDEGFDTFVLQSVDPSRGSVLENYHVLDFERFEFRGVAGRSGVVSLLYLHGFEQIDLSGPGSLNIVQSNSPQAAITIQPGGSLSIGNATTVASITGSAAGEFVSISRSTVSGAVDLGAGNDSLGLTTFSAQYGFATTTVGSADGGAGYDKLDITVDTGAVVDLAAFQSFEMIDTGLSSSVTANLTLLNLPTADLLRVDVGGIVKLGSTNRPGLHVEAFGGSRFEILEGTTVGQVTAGYPVGSGEQSIVNAGTINGGVSLGDGDDLYQAAADGIVAGIIEGGDGADRLIGAAGVDFLDGGAGADTLEGGGGNDLYVIDDAGDIVTEATGGGHDTVRTSLSSHALAPNLEALVYGGIGSFTGTGNAMANALTGGAGADTLDGGDSADLIDGRAGDDVLIGGGGADVLIGLAGNDTLDGGAGEDVADYGSATSAVVSTVRDAYAEDGSGGRDRFVGIEHLYGSSFGDVLVGSAVFNVLAGQGGDDQLYGLGGDDVIEGEAGADLIDGGEGRDRVTFEYGAAAAVVSLRDAYAEDGYGSRDRLASIEDIAGSRFADVLVGNSVANEIRAGAGDDVLIGEGGNDVIDGAAGTDTVSFGTSTAGIVVSLHDGYAEDGLGGRDILGGIESVVGSSFADVLVGSAGADTLDGGLESDQLFGLNASDALIGGRGNDRIEGGAGVDTAVYNTSAAGIVATLKDGYAEDGLGGRDTLASIENIVGSDFGDLLVGDSSANRLTGWTGNDTLVGLGGADFIDGGAGDDLFVFTVISGAATVAGFTAGAAGNDRIDISAHASINDFATLMAGGSNTAEGALLDLGSGASITILGVTKEQLTPADFII